MSHSYTCLEHAILALGASHLSHSGDTVAGTRALHHRVVAIKLFNEQIGLPPTTTDDADALFAAIGCLLSQTTLLPDGIVEYMTLTRVAGFVVNMVTPKFPSSIFHIFTPERHVDLLLTMVDERPKDIDLIDSFKSSLLLVERICHRTTELAFLTQLARCADALRTSARSACGAFIAALLTPTRFTNEEFVEFLKPGNYAGLLLTIHMLLLEYILGQACMGPSHDPKAVYRKNTVIRWTNSLAGSLPPNYRIITWENIEPAEGEFHFEQLDKVIEGARKHNLHLILLWFGSFKNGLSSYTPSWVKANPDRFPRAELGHKYGSNRAVGDVVSVFNEASRNADAREWKMKSACSVVHGTEVTRPRKKAFSSPVPSDLLMSLASNAKNLHEDLKTNFPNTDFTSLRSSSSWEVTFGTGVNTDLFMAYHYAKYLNFVAATGKKECHLPMFTNVWLNYTGGDKEESFPLVVAGGGDEPGDFPSGAPTSSVLDIWHMFAPDLDMMSPDIYLNDYEIVCKKFRHRNQALFIPEQRRVERGARSVWVAYGSYAALGASPFGIDTLDPEGNPFRKIFGLLKSVAAIVLDAHRRPGSCVGFFFDDVSDRTGANKTIVRRFGKYELTIERCFFFGKPGPGEGIVIELSEGRFLLVGCGFQVRARALDPDATFTGILKFEEKAVDDETSGELRAVRVLIGNETRSGLFAMMPNEDPDYGGFPIAITIPARTMIAELQVYDLTRGARKGNLS
ncbi:glycosyl hydrolases family [Purpureocillium lavendulum]|uniref:Glycosyl hydrolases family n=1 Tax=Purpureocillium lavendulum TaxID=1247861 RepID=A0AB34FEN1_9HYPO|nr:glycosyl hydrolases family [Purpureocillium lavendulum]